MRFFSGRINHLVRNTIFTDSVSHKIVFLTGEVFLSKYENNLKIALQHALKAPKAGIFLTGCSLATKKICIET